MTRPSKTPEARAAYWAAYRERKLPYTIRECTTCGKQFQPGTGANGNPKRCLGCRQLRCETCGEIFTADRVRRYCSRSCVGKAPGNIARIKAIPKRGKPRTYAERHRTKHGSAEEREWRTRVFERDNWTCQECGAHGVRLNADHIKPFGTHPESRFELSNGRTLCEPCHRKTPTYGWRGYWLKRRASEIAARRLAQDVLPLEVTRG